MVSFDIEPVGPMVKLTVVHDGFEPGSTVLAGVSQGWPILLASLKTLLETGEPAPGTSGPPPRVSRRRSRSLRCGRCCDGPSQSSPPVSNEAGRFSRKARIASRMSPVMVDRT